MFRVLNCVNTHGRVASGGALASKLARATGLGLLARIIVTFIFSPFFAKSDVGDIRHPIGNRTSEISDLKSDNHVYVFGVTYVFYNEKSI